MDDVGGLYRFQDFLRTINSKNPDDAEEKEDLKIWARAWDGLEEKLKLIIFCN